MDTNKDNLCSICCLTYNHSKFIRECVESLWNQEYKNIEIIVVNDGSTDNSLEILKELEKKSPCHMDVITQENTGNIGKNVNRAIKKANGNFISFISMDDKLYENAISTKIKLMLSDDNLAFVANHHVQFIDENSCLNDTYADNHNHIKIKNVHDLTVDDLLNMEYKKFHSFFIQGAIFRKKIIDSVGGFDEDITGDDIILRTKIFRYIKERPKLKFSILDDYACYYRIHGTNIHKNLYRQFLTVVHYLDRYWPDKKNTEKFYDFSVRAFFYSDLKSKLKILKIKRVSNIILLIHLLKKIFIKIYQSTKMIVMKK